MARGSSPTAEQVQRAKLTLAKSNLSAKKGKQVKLTVKMEKGGKENKKANIKLERVVSVP